MLEANYKTYCALNNMAVTVDDTKATVKSLLEKEGFAEQRARNMDIDDFLRLLKVLNEAGFHFS